MSTFSFSMGEGGIGRAGGLVAASREHASASFTGVGQTTERACLRD